MADTEMIDAHVEPGLKHEAEAVFAELGLSVGEAITLFYRQVTLQHGLPLTVKVPNADTREALRQAHEGEDLIEYPTLEALKLPTDDICACSRQSDSRGISSDPDAVAGISGTVVCRRAVDGREAFGAAPQSPQTVRYSLPVVGVPH